MREKERMRKREKDMTDAYLTRDVDERESERERGAGERDVRGMRSRSPIFKSDLGATAFV